MRIKLLWCWAIGISEALGWVKEGARNACTTKYDDDCMHVCLTNPQHACMPVIIIPCIHCGLYAYGKEVRAQARSQIQNKGPNEAGTVMIPAPP